MANCLSKHNLLREVMRRRDIEKQFKNMKKPILVVGENATNPMLKKLADKHGVELVNGTLAEKHLHIHKVLDDAQKALENLGCSHFLAAIDRDVRDADGGKVFVNSEITGPDMAALMQHAFPSDKDLIFLGLHVGNEIMRRNKDAGVTFRDKKKKSAKKVAPKKESAIFECSHCGSSGATPCLCNG